MFVIHPVIYTARKCSFCPNIVLWHKWFACFVLFFVTYLCSENDFDWTHFVSWRAADLSRFVYFALSPFLILWFSINRICWNSHWRQYYLTTIKYTWKTPEPTRNLESSTLDLAHRVSLFVNLWGNKWLFCKLVKMSPMFNKSSTFLLVITMHGEKPEMAMSCTGSNYSLSNFLYQSWLYFTVIWSFSSNQKE